MPKGERGTGKPYQKVGRDIWYIQYYVPGEKKPRRESSGSTNKTVAVKLLNKRRAEIDRGSVSNGEPLVAHLLELYLADQARQKRAGLTNAKNYVKKHLRPAFGDVKVNRLNDDLINRFIEAKRTAGLADATINRILAALKRAYMLGMKARPQLVFAVPQFDLLVETNTREGFFEYADYTAMRDRLPFHLKVLLVIGYHLGMRAGEIVKLRWDQVDWHRNLIRLEKKQTKGKQARTAPMYGELRAWLDMAYTKRGDCPFLVNYNGDGITEYKTGWDTARKAVGLPNMHVHDLRRTAVRNMIRATISEKDAMRISGHKTRAMLDRYNISDERDIQAAGGKMELYLAELKKAAEEAAAEKVSTKVSTALKVN